MIHKVITAILLFLVTFFTIIDATISTTQFECCCSKSHCNCVGCTSCNTDGDAKIGSSCQTESSPELMMFSMRHLLSASVLSVIPFFEFSDMLLESMGAMVYTHFIFEHPPQKIA